MFVGKYPTSFKLIQHSYFTSPFFFPSTYHPRLFLLEFPTSPSTSSKRLIPGTLRGAPGAQLRSVAGALRGAAHALHLLRDVATAGAAGTHRVAAVVAGICEPGPALETWKGCENVWITMVYQSLSSK